MHNQEHIEASSVVRRHASYFNTGSWMTARAVIIDKEDHETMAPRSSGFVT